MSQIPSLYKTQRKNKERKNKQRPKKGVIFPSAATQTLAGVTIYKSCTPIGDNVQANQSPNHIGTTFIENTTATFQVSRAIFLRSCTWIVDHTQEVIFDGTNAELQKERQFYEEFRI